MIDHLTVQRIIDSAEIVEVVQDFVSLKKRGVNYLGNCPFHNEKTPSFTVSPAKGIFKCFGCGESGTAVGFIMKHEHLSFVDTIKYLGQKYNIAVEEKEESLVVDFLGNMQKLHNIKRKDVGLWNQNYTKH